MKLLIMMLTVALCLAGHTVAAKMYKWVDGNGVVQYTQSPPPPGREGSEVKKHTHGVTDDQADENLRGLTDKAQTQQKDREFKKEYAGAEEQRADRMHKNCETARENLRILQNAARVRVKGDGDEDAAYLSEQQKQEKIAESQEQVKNNCN